MNPPKRNLRRSRPRLELLEDRITPAYTITDLAAFTGPQVNTGPAGNGANPAFGSLLQDSNGNLFGTTTLGSTNTNNLGTIFEWIKGTGSIQVLANFTSGNTGTGTNPESGLIADSNGNLYGTTSAGGANGLGTVFEWVKSSGTITVLGSFAGASNGQTPECTLIADGSGNLYGTTTAGGANGFGTVFEWVKSTGNINALASFTAAQGKSPVAGLITDASGNLYGTTTSGGSNNFGTVFEWVKSSGNIQVLGNFTGGAAGTGTASYSGVIADGAGNLYGTTFSGGLNNDGTIFEWVKSTGNIQVLQSFTNSTGLNSTSSLIFDSNGNLFGTSQAGGANNDGTVFEWLAGTGQIQVLSSFTGGNGQTPEGGLVADASGNLYGAAFRGGANNFGAVFEAVPPPQVVSVTPSAATTGELPIGTLTLQVKFSQVVVGADQASNYQLQNQGADGLLGNADDVIVAPVSVTYSGTTATLTFAGLTPGVWRLTVDDTITNAFGNQLDGLGNNTVANYYTDWVAGNSTQLVTNGDFENSSTGWTTNVSPNGAVPYKPWQVLSTGQFGGLNGATPQDGTHDMSNGFDGTFTGPGPMQFTMYQDVVVPAVSTVTLSWKDRLQWNMNNSVNWNPATQPRTYSVEILDPTTQTVLATPYTFTTPTSPSVQNQGDTGWLSHSFDLTKYAGTTVRLYFVESIPENSTGPGQLEIDSIAANAFNAAGFTSPNGFFFDPQTTDFGAGQLVQGTSNAFDGANRLQVNATDYQPSFGTPSLANGGLTLVTPTQIMSGLNVSRQITVPNTGADDFARTIDYFQNNTSSAISATINVIGNVGFNVNTQWTTPTGGNVPTVNDNWVEADGGLSNNLSLPPGAVTTIFVMHGFGLKPSAVNIVGDDNIEWTYNITVAANSTVELGTFTIQANSRLQAQAEVNHILQPDGTLGGQAAAFLTSADLNALLNFQRQPLPKQFVNMNSTNNTVSFTVNLPPAAPNTLTVTPTSDNQGVIPNANLSVTPGAGPSDRVLTLTPNPNVTGEANITLTVQDPVSLQSYNLVVPVLVTTTESLNFTDDFNRADIPFLGVGWNENVGDFATLGSRGIGNAAPVNLATVNGVSATDVSVLGTFQLSAVGSFAGLVARYSGPGDKNMYLGELTKTSSTVYTATILKNFGGVWTQLASQTVAAATGNDQLEFDVIGSNLTLFVDGAQAASATDISIKGAGSAGVRMSPGVTVSNFAFPFVDNFTVNGALSPPWTIQQGNFIVNSGLVNGTTGLNIATVNSLSYLNVAVQANVNLTGSGQFVGLLSRYGGPGDTNMYWAGLVGGQAQIWRNVGGNWVLLTAQSVAGTSGTLRLETASTSLKLFLNGTLVAWANDAAINGVGTVGIRMSSGATVGNFSATAIGLTNPSLAFSDNFSTAIRQQLSPNWLNQVGSFQVNGGVAAGLDTLDVATLNGVNAPDVAVQANVNLATGQYVGLVARYSGPGDGNMYWAGLVGGQAQIWRNLGGNWVELAAQNVAVSSGTLIFQVQGTSLRLLLNNSMVANAKDSALTSGSVGVRASAGATVANFSAKRYLATNAILPFSDGFNIAANQQLSNNWLNQVGNFQVAGGVATGQAGLDVATLNSVNVANVSVQADINVIVGQFSGLVARYGGPGDNNMYWAGVDATSGNYVAEIWRNVGGIWAELFAHGIGSGSGTLRFEVVGDSLKLFQQNNLVASANDTFLTTGTVGMRASSGSPLDNFSASVLAPILSFSDNFSTPSSQLSSSWATRLGNFQVSGGMATAQFGVNVATVNGLLAANSTVQALVTVANGQYGGVVSRFSGPGDSNMYWAGLYNSGGSVQVMLWLNLGGNWYELKNAAVGSNTATIQLVTSGTSLTVFVNGVSTLSVTDGNLAGPGTVGIRASAGASIQDFVATSP
ncbi:MAG TPA: choice-of-anchor tandem repeat GloVer-containing protein [Gemmataceae bacterium]|nr:choice-of-anchor tandem repeat GloVer-containing protein [Gemmataceae bacterium]